MVNINRIRRLGRDESGMTYVFIGLGLMAFLSASMLAIDVGMLMTARSQAQNSADAGALAGATALVFDDYDDRTPSGPAVQNARQAATFNRVIGGNVSVEVQDVEFRQDPTGEWNRVRVTVRRTASRGNPVSTLIAAYFGVQQTDIGAVAMAEASPANAMTCVKPFTIPDRWIEANGQPANPDVDGFDWVDKKGKPVANPDTYIGPGPGYTGYNADRDKGMMITLKADNGSKIAPSFYYPWAMAGGTGGSWYRDNIANCNIDVMGFGQTYTAEPGNMVGPTRQGMDELIAKDPNAYWDSAKNEVHSSYKPSPRVVAIPLFDPIYYAEGKSGGRNASLKFVNYLGFFVEEMQGNEVRGRVTPIGGLRKGNMGAAPPNAFPKSIRLIE
jgi:Flp pilus assembly protein TadG